jgi:hypothetical protein
MRWYPDMLLAETLSRILSGVEGVSRYAAASMALNDSIAQWSADSMSEFPNAPIPQSLNPSMTR